jgi:hypothetical protein
MKIADFQLHKLKLDSKTVVIEYNKRGSDESITSTKKELPHPDMREKLNKFRPYIMEVFKIEEGNEDCITVNGISVSSRKDVPILVVMASWTTNAGQKATLTCPVITYDNESFEECSELEAYVNLLNEECYGYLFGKKQAQQSLELESKED